MSFVRIGERWEIMMTIIEKVSRALCWSNGMNPDVTLGGYGVNFLWMEYEHQARAALNAMIGVSSSVDAVIEAELLVVGEE